MNKQFLSVLLAALMLLSLLPVGVAAEEVPVVPQLPTVTPVAEEAAESEETATPFVEILPIEKEPQELSSANFFYSVQGDAAYIQGVGSYSGERNVLTLPDKIGDYPVKGLSNFYAWGFKELVLPDSVEVIAGYFDLSSLTKLTVGAGLKSISQATLESLYELERVEVSANNPYLKSVDGIVYNANGDTVLAFPKCWGETYTVPAGVKNVDAILTSGASVQIIYPTDGTDFVHEDGVVYNADKTKIMTCDAAKSGKFVMPETVTEIAPLAFTLCTALTEVQISPNVTEISYAAFAGCTALKKVSLPQNLKSIGASAFAENDALESVVIPDGVTLIGRRAFFDCDNLTTLNLPTALQEVGDKAFEGNEKQTAQVLALPASVTRIGARAFMRTGYLAVDFSAGAPFLATNAFSDCKQLTSVKMGDRYSTTSLGREIFANCTALTDIDLGTGLRWIATGMFRGCTALKQVTVPAQVNTIGDRAFFDCINLAKVDVQSTYVDIREAAFRNTALKDISFLKNATVLGIGKHSFSNIQATSVVLPDNVTTIGYEAFRGSEKLASLDIPATVISMCGKSMLDTAWYNAQPDGAVYLEHVMLKYKGNPVPDAHVVMPDGIRVIGDYAFETVRSVSSLTLGKDVQYVGESVFAGSSIRNVYVHEENPYYYSENGILYNKAGSVVYAPVDKVELAELPYKTEYEAGEKLYVGELSLRLTRRNGTVEDFWYSDRWYPDYIEVGEVDMNTPGTKMVPVRYGAHTVEFEITVTGKPIVPGDLDGVEGVTLDDAIYLLFHVNFPEYYAVNQSVDFDGSGTVDLEDAIYFLFHVNFPDYYPI